MALLTLHFSVCCCACLTTFQQFQRIFSVDVSTALTIMPSSATIKMSRPCALWGTVIGDALAMPVHWYYSTRDIKDGYGGWLTGYTAPNVKHPTSILTLSATGE